MSRNRKTLVITMLAAALVLPLHAETLPANTSQQKFVPQDARTASSIAQTLAKIKMPQGFRISLVAQVPGARHMAVSANGKVIFVGTNADRAYVIEMKAGGTPAEARFFAPAIALTKPNGPCLAPDGTLYLSEQNRILAFKDAEAKFAEHKFQAEVIVKKGELIPREEESRNHSARVCRIGPDNKLYVALGQPYNVPPKNRIELYERLGIGGIIRMARDGTNREVFALGIRNSVGIDFNPADKLLWFTDNQVDGMGDDIPPGELNRATAPGQHFGFPWYGGGDTRTKEYAKDSPPEGVIFPQVNMVAHAADLGLTFYNGTQFPQKYRGGIFSAQHGSWDRSEPVGARVMFTSLKPDGTADKTEVFAEGWLIPNGGYLGRPVDVAPMPDGSMLISDDDAGAVYRVTYEGKQGG
jgi:glucose/arabinose dehydrogenase